MQPPQEEEEPRDDMQDVGAQQHHEVLSEDVPKQHPAAVHDQAVDHSPAAGPLSSGEREVNVSQAVEEREKHAEQLGPRISLGSSPSRNPPPAGQPSPGLIEQQVAEQDGKSDGRENVLQRDEQASSRGGEQAGQDVGGSNNGINKPVDNSSVSPQEEAMRDDFVPAPLPAALVDGPARSLVVPARTTSCVVRCKM